MNHLPNIAAAQVIMERGDVGSVRDEINEVIDRELADIQAFCMELVKREDSGVLRGFFALVMGLIFSIVSYY